MTCQRSCTCGFGALAVGGGQWRGGAQKKRKKKRTYPAERSRWYTRARVLYFYFLRAYMEEKVWIFGFIKIVLRDACAAALIIVTRRRPYIIYAHDRALYRAVALGESLARTAVSESPFSRAGSRFKRSRGPPRNVLGVRSIFFSSLIFPLPADTHAPRPPRADSSLERFQGVFAVYRRYSQNFKNGLAAPIG